MNRWTGILLILLTVTVSIPLTIKTFTTNGGTWGFGVVGLSILLPLSFYFLFGVAGVIRDEEQERRIFVLTHVLTIVTGVVTILIFPLYPLSFITIPVVLAIVGITDKKRLRLYLLLMIFLGVVANALLLKWEFDYHRTLPLFQLFQASAPATD